ncbi:hypothetical protein K470DRAFT_262358 [Piedraia hortae CBS 480.64]|uniref:ADF-H domain-containing protein n=1 Tax=Piedraia hortae CBS 480.64 TaxID=1314780 RepID=A0A6A7C776_9PEZI|nr:hypothetical protein K470DRAFT_262358 [Piedraia hortae CBS 480.64]
MSLNGLDTAAVQEAYAASLADPGVWFVLKYSARDCVELLGRGKGGVHEARTTITQYTEPSPLYGLVTYRRRKVLFKYTPEGTSRLLQARTVVHFQDVLEQFSPYETYLEFTTPESLNDTALASSFPLHTASPIASASSTRLNEIAEDGDEVSTFAVRPQTGHSSSSSVFGFQRYVSEKRVERIMGGGGTERPRWSGSSAAFGLRPPSPLTLQPSVAPPVLAHDEANPPDSDSVVAPDQQPSVVIVPAPAEPPDIATHPALRAPVEMEGIDWSKFDPKPKTKLGPRPVLADELTKRPLVATVSTIPASVRSPQKKQERMRPAFHEAARAMQPTSPGTHPAPSSDMAETMSRPMSRGSITSMSSRKSSMHSMHSTDRARLLKAVELRQRQVQQKMRSMSQDTVQSVISEENGQRGPQVAEHPAVTLQEEPLREKERLQEKEPRAVSEKADSGFEIPDLNPRDNGKSEDAGRPVVDSQEPQATTGVEATELTVALDTKSIPALRTEDVSTQLPQSEEPPSVARKNSSSARRRRGLLVSLHVETDCELDPEELQQLKNATVEQATPVTLSRSPVTVSPERRPSLFSSKSNSSVKSIDIRKPASPKPPDLPGEALSPQRVPSTSSQKSDVRSGVKRNVSADITRRIQTLAEASSSKECLTPPRVQSPDLLPPGRIRSPPPKFPRSRTPVQFETKHASQVRQGTESSAESVSVKARIVRPNMTGESSTDVLQQPQLVIDHKRASQPKPQDKPSFSPQPELANGSTRNIHFERPDTLQMVVRSTFTENLTSPVRGPSRGSSVSTDQQTITSANSGSKEKEGNRASRFIKRMSHLGAKRRSQQPLASTPKDKSVILGNLNVQFPDSLLWKRRHASVDEQSYIVFSNLDSITAESRGIAARKFKLDEFREPFIPDLDREELAHSIVLDSALDGSCLQVACADATAQKVVLGKLVERWKLATALPPSPAPNLPAWS